MRAFAPAAALRRPVVANLRRGWPQPPDAPIPEGLWSLRLLESYPYKLARRANPPPQRRKAKPSPPLEVTREAADAAAEKLKDGANGFIAKGKNRLLSARAPRAAVRTGSAADALFVCNVAGQPPRGASLRHVRAEQHGG
jgi:hypothetical protein